MTVLVPTLAVASYNVCVYSSNATSGTTALLVTTTTPYVATAALTSATVTPAAGAPGATVAVADTNTGFGPGTAVEFNTAVCPATYATATAPVFAATVATFTPGATSLSVTVPTGMSMTANFYACVYTGTTTASVLITRTSAAVFGFTPLTVSPTKGPAAGTNTITATDATATFGASTAVEFRSAAAGACTGTYTTLPTAGVFAGSVTGFTTTTLTISVPALVVGTYSVCAYNGTANNSALVSSAAGYATVATGTLADSTPARGTSNGGNTITTADATMAFGATTTIEFQTGSACSATYTAPGPGVVAAIGTSTVGAPTALSIVVPALPAASYLVCAYTGTSVGTSALISGTATASYTVYGVLTLSTNSGPTGGHNPLTATMGSGQFPATTVVLFVSRVTSAACPATYLAANVTFTATGLRILGPTKLALTVPTTVVTAGGIGPNYNVCAYADDVDTTSPLISETVVPYSVATAATMTSVVPSAGAAQGGTVITVNGTSLSGIVSATVGGVPLIHPTSINGGTAFTATTPAHAPSGYLNIEVVTAGGSITMPNAFKYSNGIVVAPNKASNNASVDVDVAGVGFSAITFDPLQTTGTNPTDPTGHVYLVNGVYDPTGLTGATFKANAGLLECTDVLVISDIELVCTMHLAGEAGRQAFRGADLVLTNTANIAKGGSVLTAAGAAFTPADVGLTVTSTTAGAIPAGTTIVAVIDATQVVLSQKATAVIASGPATFAIPRTIAATTIDVVANALRVTKAAAPFTAADIGKTISCVAGPACGIQPGTTIVNVINAGADAVLSSPATVSSGGATLSVTVGNPAVPQGTYTVTVVNNGAVDASGASYSQSVVSSGSTFTVSDY